MIFSSLGTEESNSEKLRCEWIKPPLQALFPFVFHIWPLLPLGLCFWSTVFQQFICGDLHGVAGMGTLTKKEFLQRQGWNSDN